MHEIILDKGFDESDIRILRDDSPEYEKPSGANVKRALQWLCSDRTEDDVLYMHFSGHGTQVPSDGDDEEVDQLDEALVLSEMFLLADDDLRQFFSAVPPGCRVTVTTDCCHSGGMLDHTEVQIEGSKDEDSSGGFLREGQELLDLLGGTREAVVENTQNRSLPISTIASFLSDKVGEPVPDSGVRGALAQLFGGDACKLAMSFAAKRVGGGEAHSNPLSSLLGGSKSGGGGFSSFLGGMLGEGSSGQRNPLGSLFGGSKSTSESSDPVGAVIGMLGQLGLGGLESLTASGAPAYKPTESRLSSDVGVLITGCQAHETSADVRPPSGGAFGALSNAIKTVYNRNPNATHYELVQGARAHLSKGGFKQNPCLECSAENAQLPFIC